ncbi:hypothetical protein PoB_002676600 [Plakobranchus ocellatus]|uniref:SWIM-type domain-containing protein n=1 Tax=Plakobranchus ocellatus TaxID=259542 RepID=A0AAV3ZWG3_9GAST|nr:hypothetical protein PoB_002676600 [Plakobranchus ocellatus]
MFSSKFVTSIHFLEGNETDDEEVGVYKFHFRSKVKAEMKKRDNYVVKSWISSDNKVLSCECECAGGARPACCKHAFGLLYAILDYSKNEMFSAPTEKLQTWHHPRTFVVSPKKTQDCFQPSSSQSKVQAFSDTTVNYSALVELPSVTPIFSVCMRDNTPLDSFISYDKSIPLPNFPIVSAESACENKNFNFLCDDDKKYFEENINLSIQKAQRIEHNTQSQSSSVLMV